MCLASICIDGGAANNILCSTSSHFCSAEKQFRFPLELGNQRPQTSQWTVTGSGSAILSKNGNGPFITYITPRKNC
jgi:stage V sporulation protein AD